MLGGLCLALVLCTGSADLDRRDIPLDMGETDYLYYCMDIVGAGEHYYALENMEGRILCFDDRFRLERVISRKGQGPGELENPVLISVWGDLIAVKDERGFSFFTGSGEFISRFRTFFEVVSFVFTHDRIYAIVGGLNKDHAGIILDQKGRILGQFGSKPGYDSMAAEAEQRYDTGKYFVQGTVLTDGRAIYYVEARFGRLREFDLDGREVRQRDITVTDNDQRIVSENRRALMSGRKKYGYEQGGRRAEALETYKLFRDAALVGDAVWTLDGSVFPTEGFTISDKQIMRRIPLSPSEPVRRLVTDIPSQGGMSRGAYLHAMTSPIGSETKGVVCVMSLEGITTAVVLEQR